MKILLIVNLVFAGLFFICFWIFRFFAFGVFVNPIGLIFSGFCMYCASIQLVSTPALLIVNIYGIFKYWSKYKLVTLVPFLIIGITVAGLFVLDTNEMSMKRFEKYLPDYEAFVKMAEQEYKHSDWKMMPMPKEYKRLGYRADIFYDKPASDNEPNTMFVLFLVGSAGFAGHTAFLYSSNSNMPCSNDETWQNRMRSRSQRINEHWFRVSD